MEISESSIGVFYLSRILGIGPYVISRNKKGRIEIKRSIFVTIYSCAIILILASLTYNGLLFDAKSKVPIRPSFRMRSATSKVVTAIDVSVVVLATVTGVMCGIIGLEQTQELNNRLREADETLSLYTDKVKDRRRSYILMAGVMGFLSMMLGLDIWSWYRVASTMTEEGFTPQINVRWYIPFYGLYYVLMGLHIHLAQSAVGLGRRYRRLNLALKNSFQEDIKLYGKRMRKDGRGIIPVIGVDGDIGTTAGAAALVKTVDILSSSKYNNQRKMPPGEKIINGGLRQVAVTSTFSTTKQYTIERLAYTHDLLGKAVNNVSSAFGFTILFMLVSCLLHLVATSYFLFLEVLVKKDSMVSWLQALWLLFHISRLLLIVEPCHVTIAEAKQTIVIVSEIQRNCKDENIGNRISGATYLVILIQFQKTDG